MTTIYIGDFNQALTQLHPTVFKVENDKAYDEHGAEVLFDKNEVTALAIQIQQDRDSVKNSALAKLAALGLTVDEVKSILG